MANSPKSLASRNRRAPVGRSTQAFILAGLPLVAVALGGSTARWSEGVILVLVGLLLLAIPPRVSLGWKINLVLAALLALVGTAYLPAAWFHIPAWRAALADDLGATLPATLGVQPWMTAESLVLLAGGMTWFYLNAATGWTVVERSRAGAIFSAGVVALAAVFSIFHALHYAPPTWHTERGFGPFPNRNQTADFLAVGSLPVLALSHLAWRAGRRGAAAAWLFGWAIVAAGLFQNYSRAGILLLFAGTAAYVGNEVLRAFRKTRLTDGKSPVAPLGPWRVPALGASFVLLLAAGFMLFGGETLGRLRPGSTDVKLLATAGDFRQQIQRDALDLIVDSPWCGAGLGSFEGVFPPYRTRSIVNLHTVHPESDWVWLTAELGWPGFALVLAGTLLLAARIWPQRSGTDRPLRAAAALGAIAFALHGFVDVSAHRVGTAWCGIFLIGLALPGVSGASSGGESSRDFGSSARWLSPLFRILGLALAAVGAIWISQEHGRIVAPGTQAAAHYASLSRAKAFNGQWKEAVNDASLGLAIDPLNWPLYFQRAVSRLGAREGHPAAQADFRRALYLEPFSGAIAEIIAENWARAGESDLAVSALLDACRRIPDDSRTFMQAVVAAAGNDPAFLDRLAAATHADPDLQLVYLEQLPLPAQGAAVARIVAADPELHRFDDRQRIHLFRVWLSDAPALLAAMDSHPEWQALGWRQSARAAMITGKSERACGLAVQYAPKPVLPVATGPERLTLGELRVASQQSPASADIALRLYRAQLAAEDKVGAQVTAHAFATRPGSPAYFHYLEAILATEAGDWNAAWDAWSAYLDTVG